MGKVKTWTSKKNSTIKNQNIEKLTDGRDLKKKKIVIIETMTKLVPTARDYLEEPPTPSSNTFFRIQKHGATKHKEEGGRENERRDEWTNGEKAVKGPRGLF